MLQERLRKGLKENFNSEDEDADVKKKRIMTEEEMILVRDKGDGYLNPR